MRLRSPHFLHILLAIALAVFGYGMFFITLAPIPVPLLEASGRVTSAEAHRRKGSIQTIYFSVHGSTRRFAYPGILPRIDAVWSSLALGSDATVLYADKDLSTDVVDVWGLTVDGRYIVQPQESYGARRKNGYWGLAIGIAFTLSAAYIWLKGGKRAA